MKKVVDFKRLGIVFNPREQNSIIQRNNVKQLEDQLGFILKDYKILCEKDNSRVLPKMENNVDVVFLPADSMVKSLEIKIMAEVNKYNIPSLSCLGGDSS